jgi:hypothetical protein
LTVLGDGNLYHTLRISYARLFTAGAVDLVHFAGGAGAVAILLVRDNADPASVVASADVMDRTKREQSIANPFFEHFTVVNLMGLGEWQNARLGTLLRRL